jgi:hypothetical protein
MMGEKTPNTTSNERQNVEYSIMISTNIQQTGFVYRKAVFNLLTAAMTQPAK